MVRKKQHCSIVLDIKMDTSTIATFNVTSIAECILELVSNSLNSNATSIAIRIHAEKRKIQVIDNGIGISKKRLQTIAEYNGQISYNCWNIQDICNSKKQTLTNIRKLSDAVLIASRYFNSSKTYMKIFKVCQSPNIVKIRRRPSHGTTVSIYGFHELSLNKWNTSLVYHLIANIALVNLKVSFSIRDDQQRKVTMIIPKLHNPTNIFKLLYNEEIILHNIWYIKSTEEFDIKFCAYVGLTDVTSNATQHTFLNNKLVHCPLIMQIISATFINAFRCFTKMKYEQILTKKKVFILLFITCTEYIFTVENGKRTLILPSVQGLVQSIKKEILNIFTKNIMPLSNSVPKCGTKYSWHSIYHIKRKITKLKISQIRENTITKVNYVNYINQLQTDNLNTQEKLSQNKDNDTQMATNAINNIVQLFTPISQGNNINKKNIILTLSEWSNWSYAGSESCNLKKIQNASKLNHFNSNSLKVYKHFDFLPEKLHKQLRGNTKLTKTDVLNELDGNISSTRLKFGLQIPDTLLHQELDVRPCKAVQRWREFRLKKELLKFIKILGQLNNELIVGLIVQNDAKVLVLMDQHAIHERIRYENLLDKYKSQTRNYFLFTKLKDPIAIQLSVEKCGLLVSNKVTLTKLGINLNVVNDNTVIVYTVPECLKNNKYYNETKLKLNVENLLNEILQSIITHGYYQTTNLPLTIHNKIAMEACHGAIKFGDPLTLKECKWLLKLLNKTKAPTRCAHGRPSIVPLLELTELEKRHKKVTQGKLNFESLKSYRDKKI